MDENLAFVNELERIAASVVDVAFKIHQDLGGGALESLYQQILAKKLEKEGFSVKCEVPISFEYDGIKFENEFRIDLFIDEKLIVELKATERMNPVFARQMNTYLILKKLPLGLLINFGGDKFRGNCKRIINPRHPLTDLLVANSKFESKMNELKE